MGWEQIYISHMYIYNHGLGYTVLLLFDKSHELTGRKSKNKYIYIDIIIQQFELAIIYLCSSSIKLTNTHTQKCYASYTHTKNKVIYNTFFFFFFTFYVIFGFFLLFFYSFSCFVF